MQINEEMLDTPIEKMSRDYEQIVDKVQMTFNFIKIGKLKITEILFLTYQMAKIQKLIVTY